MHPIGNLYEPGSEPGKNQTCHCPKPRI